MIVCVDSIFQATVPAGVGAAHAGHPAEGGLRICVSLRDRPRSPAFPARDPRAEVGVTRFLVGSVLRDSVTGALRARGWRIARSVAQADGGLEVVLGVQTIAAGPGLTTPDRLLLSLLGLASPDRPIGAGGRLAFSLTIASLAPEPDGAGAVARADAAIDTLARRWVDATF